MRQAPFGHDGATPRNNAVMRFAVKGHDGKRTPAWMVKIIYALLCLLDQGIAEYFPGQSSALPFTFSNA